MAQRRTEACPLDGKLQEAEDNRSVTASEKHGEEGTHCVSARSSAAVVIPASSNREARNPAFERILEDDERASVSLKGLEK